MALVGHISGSTQSSSVIGVSGSVIIANKPNATFPGLPGTDVSFYVAGNTTTEKSVFGGDLVASGTLNARGNATVAGSLQAASLTATGQLTAATGSITGNASVGGNLTVTGDLTVNGTTATVNTTNLEVKDKVIGLGFASGTIAQSSNGVNGDRGWIGGLANTNNVMNKWDNIASEFVFATTTSSATGSFGIAAYSNLHAANIQGSIISASLGFSGSHTSLLDGTPAFLAGANVLITSASNGAVTISATSSGGSGDPGASYLVLSTTGSLTNERALVAGTGLSAVDGGANGNYTLAINDSVVATVSGTTFQGTIKPDASGFRDLGTTGASWYRGYISQISGSLTKLLDGTSYLIAGSGTSIVTGSNGAITISATGTPAGSNTQVQYNNNGSFGASSTFTFNTTGNILAALNASVTALTASSVMAAASTVNLFNTTATTVNFAGSAPSVSIGAASGRTTVNNDLAIATGNVIGAPGAGANVLSLLSSGNIVMKLDVDNNAAGHKFDVQDYQGISQFFVGENGNAELSGTLVISGSSLSTPTSATTFNLVNTNSTIVNFAGGASSQLNIGNIAGTNTVLGQTKFNQGLSGSHTKLADGTSYLIAGSNITIVTGSNGAVTIGTSGLGAGDVTGPGSSTQYAVALFDDTSGKVIRNSALTTDGNNSLWIGNTLNVSGSTTFGASAVPSADMLYNLGSPSARWANVYTGDLHLRNERGDYTLIEEENFLSIRFNRTGKRYKFVLEAVPDLDEDPPVIF